MDFTDYIFTLLNNETKLAVLFLLFLAFYYFAFYRKLSFNIFDAFTIEMISSAGAALGVYVMFVYGSPDKKYLFSFLTCEIALFAAIFLVRHFANRYLTVNNSIGSGIILTKTQEDYLRVFFTIVFSSYVILQLVSIKLVGFLLFSTDEGVTHVNAFDSYGALFSLLFTMNPVFTVCLFIKRKIFKKLSIFDYFCILVALFSMFMSGSKSSFAVFFSAFAVVDYKFAKLENKNKTKIPIIFLILLFLSIILILTIGNISSFVEDTPLNKLFQRIAVSGDGFVIGYDDSAIRYVLNGPKKTAFGYILYPFYGIIARILGSPLRPSIVGVDLYQYAFGITDAGANGRHNLLSVVFWGPYWGWMLSFIIGAFIGYVRFYLFEKVVCKNVFYFIFVCIVTTIVPVCITDAYLFSSTLYMLCAIFVAFLIATVIVYEVINMVKALLSNYFLVHVIKNN